MVVYILKSSLDGSFYVGMSSNIGQRLRSHNTGKVKSTKSRVPWTVVHSEEYQTNGEARKREKYYKTAAGRRFRKEVLGL